MAHTRAALIAIILSATSNVAAASSINLDRSVSHPNHSLTAEQLATLDAQFNQGWHLGWFKNHGGDLAVDDSVRGGGSGNDGVPDAGSGSAGGTLPSGLGSGGTLLPPGPGRGGTLLPPASGAGGTMLPPGLGAPGALVPPGLGQVRQPLDIASDTSQVTAVPEPATLLLMGGGIMGVATKLRKRRKQWSH
jgi:hypothetical protein